MISPLILIARAGKSVFNRYGGTYPSLLIGLAILWFHAMLSADRIFVGRDLGIYFLPPRYTWVHMLKALQLPLWNPHTFSGLPLIATLQPAVFYPPHLLYFFLPFGLAWNWLIIAHFAFAGVAMYLLLKHLETSDISAFVGGLVFMLSGYMFSNLTLVTFLFAVPWTPLILLFYLRHLDTSRPRYLAIAASLFFIQFCAGAPEATVMTVFLLLLISLFGKEFTSSHRGCFTRCKPLVVLVLLFVLLSAVQLFPFYELALRAWRGGGLSYTEATAWSFAPQDFLQLFLQDPFAYGAEGHNLTDYWTVQLYLPTLYLGTLPFLLSGLSFVLRTRRREASLLLLIMGLSLLLALGKNTPLYRFLHLFPPFNSFRYPVKFLFLFFFGISVLSAFGFDGLRIVAVRKRLLRRLSLHLGIVLVCLAFATAILLASPLAEWVQAMPSLKKNYLNGYYINRLLAFTLLFAVLGLVCLKWRRGRVLLIAVPLLLAVDLFAINYDKYTAAPLSLLTSPKTVERYDFMKANERMDRYFVTPDTIERFYYNIRTRLLFPFYYSSLHGLYSIDGVEVLSSRSYALFLVLLHNPGSPDVGKRLMDIAAIRYVIASTPFREQDFGEGTMSFLMAENIEKIPLFLYDYRASPGKFRLFSKALYVRNDDEAAQRLWMDKEFDSRHIVLIERDKAGTEGVDETRGSVSLLSYSPNKVVLHVNTDTDAYVYAADAYDPGWKAYVDGRKTKIYKANLAFRAVRVPAGRHTITFLYSPSSFWLGLVCTGIGLLILTAVLLKDRKHHHPNPRV